MNRHVRKSILQQPGSPTIMVVRVQHKQQSLHDHFTSPRNGLPAGPVQPRIASGDQPSTIGTRRTSFIVSTWAVPAVALFVTANRINSWGSFSLPPSDAPCTRCLWPPTLGGPSQNIWTRQRAVSQGQIWLRHGHTPCTRYSSVTTERHSISSKPTNCLSFIGPLNRDQLQVRGDFPPDMTWARGIPLVLDEGCACPLLPRIGHWISQPIYPSIDRDLQFPFKFVRPRAWRDWWEDGGPESNRVLPASNEIDQFCYATRSWATDGQMSRAVLVPLWWLMNQLTCPPDVQAHFTDLLNLKVDSVSNEDIINFVCEAWKANSDPTRALFLALLYGFRTPPVTQATFPSEALLRSLALIPSEQLHRLSSNARTLLGTSVAALVRHVSRPGPDRRSRSAWLELLTNPFFLECSSKWSHSVSCTSRLAPSDDFGDHLAKILPEFRTLVHLVPAVDFQILAEIGARLVPDITSLLTWLSIPAPHGGASPLLVGDIQTVQRLAPETFQTLLGTVSFVTWPKVLASLPDELLLLLLPPFRAALQCRLTSRDPWDEQSITALEFLLFDGIHPSRLFADCDAVSLTEVFEKLLLAMATSPASAPRDRFLTLLNKEGIARVFPRPLQVVHLAKPWTDVEVLSMVSCSDPVQAIVRLEQRFTLLLKTGWFLEQAKLSPSTCSEMAEYVTTHIRRQFAREPILSAVSLLTPFRLPEVLQQAYRRLVANVVEPTMLSLDWVHGFVALLSGSPKNVIRIPPGVGLVDQCVSDLVRRLPEIGTNGTIEETIRILLAHPIWLDLLREARFQEGDFRESPAELRTVEFLQLGYKALRRTANQLHDLRLTLSELNSLNAISASDFSRYLAVVQVATLPGGLSDLERARQVVREHLETVRSLDHLLLVLSKATDVAEMAEQLQLKKGEHHSLTDVRQPQFWGPLQGFVLPARQLRDYHRSATFSAFLDNYEPLTHPCTLAEGVKQLPFAEFHSALMGLKNKRATIEEVRLLWSGVHNSAAKDEELGLLRDLVHVEYSPALANSLQAYIEFRQTVRVVRYLFRSPHFV
ncbi:hypothetical protein PAPYR_8322 [Paratrimastix pyriformis]|uniref:Uncharacterized protein n=1 Tax=Paratrimastix pyriformis TaxID=342808 RepID=A0ABQ8UDA1_9EUKA|nr:hypothetical protein PAPYR_8322 [Paratrimastix pyriformis]